MGLHAVQMARACGARVIAAIRSKRRQDAVVQSGADVVIDTHDDFAKEVRRMNEDSGVDVVLDFVATRETLNTALSVLSPGGRLVIMGYFPRGGVLETPTWLFTEEIVVTGNRSAGRQDVADAVALIRDGRIKPVISKIFSLRDAAEAHRAFEAGEIVGRAVLVV